MTIPTDIPVTIRWRFVIPTAVAAGIVLGGFMYGVERQEATREAALQEALANKDPKAGPVYYDYPPDVRPVQWGTIPYYFCEESTLIYVVPSGSAFYSDDREYIPDSPECK